MPDTKMRSVMVVVLLAALMAGGFGVYRSRQPVPAPIVLSGLAAPAVASSLPPATVVKATTVAPAPRVPVVTAPVPSAPAIVAAAPKPVLLYVHVAGAVRQPSLYQLPADSRVMHAIKAAGGPTSKADLDAINLAEKIHDGEKIFVPTKAAVQSAAKPAPVPVAVEAPSARVAVVRTASTQRSAGKPAASAKAGKLTSLSQGKVDINTAGTEQLETLPAIGPAMAGRIIAYRQQAGAFQKVDDLMNVSGIGPKKFARMEPFVKL